MFEDSAADADEEAEAVAEPTELKFVGPATADVFSTAEFTAQDVADKAVSFRMLVDAGVNPGVAAKIRRWHSLSWSFESGDDLDRRSQQVRHLQDDERDWVASSYGDGDTAAEADADPDEAPADDASSEAEWVANAAGEKPDDEDDPDAAADDPDLADEAAWVSDSSGSGDESATTADGSGDPLAAEAAWRERSKPTPLTDIDDIDEAAAEDLEAAGVASVRSLATADPELLSDVTGIDAERLAAWHEVAVERAD